MGHEYLTNGFHEVQSENNNAHDLIVNDQFKPWVVQKFGGTSVGKEPGQIVERIVKQYLQENRVAVVCSARSSTLKVEGTTNR